MKGAIERIQVGGFKSIKQADIQLKPLNLLIGPNGAGKSNFIQLFRLLDSLSKRRFQLYVGTAGGANNLLHYGRKRTPEINIKIISSNKTDDYECRLLATDRDSLYVSGDNITLKNEGGSGGIGVWKMDPQDSNSSKPVDHSIDGIDYDMNFVGAILDCRIYHFQDTGGDARVKQSCELHDNRELKTDAANLAAFLYLLKTKHNNEYKRIVETVRLAAPYFDDFLLEPLALNTEMIRLEWREKDNEHVFGPSALSDGTLRFICLATALLQPNLPSTLLIDEPELGLHPYAITLLAELIREASLKTQVIVSTQSVTLVNQFEPTDIIVVDRENGQSVFKRLDEAQIATWLEDYGLGDLWEKNLLGGRP